MPSTTGGTIIDFDVVPMPRPVIKEAFSDRIETHSVVGDRRGGTVDYQTKVIRRVLGVFQNSVACRYSSDSDEEPVTKQPRLSRKHSKTSGKELLGQSARSSRTRRHRTSRSPYHEDPTANRVVLSDTDASSENRSIGDGSYFEVRIRGTFRTIGGVVPFLQTCLLGMYVFEENVHGAEEES
ncbi:hypothetical protein K0M31_010988 [Melipona bicolor]|uniref:Uncharacterized protein n=1 Tax=Melipona bicolor TaxID=60889 RepID=A0AA40FL21_9HYME|nr:hypothetical protein K0M31_010988 [Melipona bicolor]